MSVGDAAISPREDRSSAAWCAMAALRRSREALLALTAPTRGRLGTTAGGSLAVGGASRESVGAPGLFGGLGARLGRGMRTGVAAASGLLRLAGRDPVDAAHFPSLKRLRKACTLLALGVDNSRARLVGSSFIGGRW